MWRRAVSIHLRGSSERAHGLSTQGDRHEEADAANRVVGGGDVRDRTGGDRPRGDGAGEPAKRLYLPVYPLSLQHARPGDLRRRVHHHHRLTAAPPYGTMTPLPPG